MPDNKVRQADSRDRAIKATEMRIQGYTFQQIADQLGWADPSGAQHAIRRNLVRREVESVDELRAVHSARLEQLLAVNWQAALQGDRDASNIVLKSLDRLSRLFGLDVVKRPAVEQISDVEFAEAAAQLIESMSPGVLAEALRSLPGGAGLALTARVAGDTQEAARDGHNAGRDVGNRYGLMDSDGEPWSNL